MTTQYFIPASQIHSDRVLFEGEEAKHLVKVLRARSGDVVQVTDGEGQVYQVRLTAVGSTQSTGHIVERSAHVGEPTYHLTMAVGLLKNAKRFEYVLEKSVETGVSCIIPLITERSEKTSLRKDRATRILVAALKQCGRSRLPDIQDPVVLPEFLKLHREPHTFVCHEAQDVGAHLLEQCQGLEKTARMTVLVGPEGGFSEDEMQTIQEQGATPVTLGPRRLRTETAAIVASSVIMAAFDGYV